MTTVDWTDRAQADLVAIRAFIELDSSHYANLVTRRLLSAVDRLTDFPESGRIVPEFADPSIREVILAPYRVVYRIISGEEVHVLVIHHAARGEINKL